MTNRKVSRMLKLAANFMEQLPPEAESPSITTNDNYIEFEWYRLPRRVVSACLDPTGRVHWAALIENEDPRGHFDIPGKVPNEFVEYLYRIMEEKNGD